MLALRRDTVGYFVEPEALSGRPEDRLVAVIVREIDERAGRPVRTIGRPRARGRHPRQNDERSAHHVLAYGFAALDDAFGAVT